MNNKFLEQSKVFINKSGKKIENIKDLIIKYMYKYSWLIITVVASIVFFVAIYFMRDVVSGDVKAFLVPWYTRFYNDGFAALGQSFGDYTPSYMYILYFISLFQIVPKVEHVDSNGFTSLIPNPELVYAIKAFSILFQVLCAIFIFLTINKITKNKFLSSVGYSLGLIAPTLFLNSGWWGQCDAIYVTFLVIAIYYFIDKKPLVASIFLGLSFCFKLQAIFVIPLVLLLWTQKKYKLYYLLVIPVVYFIAGIPALIAGKSLEAIFRVFIDQTTNGYSQLSLNASTIWTLLFRNFMSNEQLEAATLAIALVTIGIAMVALWRKNIDLGKPRNIIRVAYFFSLLMPFMMPHMHDRYYYLADVLAILYLLTFPKKFYIPLLTSLVSFAGYARYLWSFNIFWDSTGATSSETSFRIGSFIMIIAIVLLAVDLYKNKVLENKDIESIEYRKNKKRIQRKRS